MPTTGWSSGPNDAWILNEPGTTLEHWDGNALSTVFTMPGYGPELTGIAGSSSTDVWAVGGGGTTLHFHVPGAATQ
jgi:hypothetical protein